MGVLPFDGQHVWLWGRRLPAYFLLSSKKHGTYEVQADAVNFYCRSELNNEAKCAFVEFFYKQELAGRGEQLLQAWEKKMGVRHTGLKVHRMKTRWGSCNVRTGSINLNTLLACWPQECLEYIVVHELAHCTRPIIHRAFMRLSNAICQSGVSAKKCWQPLNRFNSCLKTKIISIFCDK